MHTSPDLLDRKPSIWLSTDHNRRMYQKEFVWLYCGAILYETNNDCRWTQTAYHLFVLTLSMLIYLWRSDMNRISMLRLCVSKRCGLFIRIQRTIWNCGVNIQISFCYRIKSVITKLFIVKQKVEWCDDLNRFTVTMKNDPVFVLSSAFTTCNSPA